MMAVWVLVVVACSGPGPAGECVTKREAAHTLRWDCRLEAIKRETMDDRVRAYCQREGR